MSSKLTCEVCGGGEYYTESGYYFCGECHAQSQEVVEDVVNPEEVYVYGRSRSVKSNASTSSLASQSGGHDWTTWEAYNFILKGMVDELISVGAPPQLKLVVLQLWVMLLKKLSIAFLSNHRDCLPKLGFGYHDKDMHIIYGVSDKKNRKKKKKPTTSETCTPLKRGKAKKALAKENYDRFSVDTDDGLSLLDDSSDDSRFHSSSSHKKLLFRSKMLTLKAKEMYRKMKSEKSKNKKRVSVPKRRERDPSCISRSRLLAVLYLGLRLIDSDIFLGDIIRWISEGFVSYHEVSHFFPAYSNIKSLDGWLFASFPRTVVHSTVRKTTAELAKLLNFDTFPVPNILSLAARYIKELQLPYDVLTCVTNLFALCKSEMKFSVTCTKVPNFEARAMAFIVIVLKLLFGLDGKMEDKISETAAEFNTYLDREEPKLFVWNDWKKYIEYRKAFVSHFHFHTKDEMYRDCNEETELYIADLKRQRQKDEFDNKRLLMKNTSMKLSVTSVLEQQIGKLAALEPSHFSRLEFKASLMPSTSNLDLISEMHSLGVETEIQFPEQLKQDFKVTQLKFLLDPYGFISEARQRGMKIKLSKTSAQKDEKKVKVKTRKETNALIKIFLQDDNVSSEAGEDLDHCAASRIPNNTTAEQQSSVGSESFNREANSGIEYSFLKPEAGKKRKLFHASEKSESRTLKKKHKPESDLCFRGKCKIGSIDVPVGNRTNPLPKRCSKKHFKIHVPSAHYWFTELPPKRVCSADVFNSQVMSRFPSSFQWLLSECASLLRLTEQELYTEVVLVETLYGYVLSPRSNGSNNVKIYQFLKHMDTVW